MTTRKHVGGPGVGAGEVGGYLRRWVRVSLLLVALASALSVAGSDWTYLAIAVVSLALAFLTGTLLFAVRHLI